MNKYINNITILSILLLALQLQANTQEVINANFKKDIKSKNLFNISKRSNKVTIDSTTMLRLRGGSGVLSKSHVGTGTYHVRFKLDESNSNFKYHQNYFVFLYNGKDITNCNDAAAEGDFYGIRWEKSGKVHFFKSTPTLTANGKKLGKTELLGIWQKPGPATKSRIKPGNFVDLTIKLNSQAKSLKVFLNRKSASGKPDCEFGLPEDAPKTGSFGFINNKWYSLVYLEELNYTP